MATIAARAMQFFHKNGGACEMDTVNTASSAHTEGDLLVRVNNIGTICAQNAATISFLAPTAAANTIPGSTAGDMPLIKVRAGDEFEATLFHSTASSAVLADADIDDRVSYGLIRGTISSQVGFYVNKGDTSNAVCEIVKRLDGAADLYPRVVIHFNPSYLTFR